MHLTVCAAAELGRDGIRVNAICPGLPEDIAKACRLFASDDSEFVTGASLLVDGGMHVGPRTAWDPEARAERARMTEDRRAAWEASQAEDF